MQKAKIPRGKLSNGLETESYLRVNLDLLRLRNRLVRPALRASSLEVLFVHLNVPLLGKTGCSANERKNRVRARRGAHLYF